MIPVTFNKDDLNNPKKGTVNPEALSALVGLLYPTQVGVLDIFENPVAVTNVDLSTTGYATLTFSKGYVVCYGRLIYVEQGEQATLPLPASNETGNLGVRINLTASGANEVEWFAKSGTLRTDNLLNNPATGVYEIKLYSYTASSSTFVVGTRVATKVANMNDYLKGANFTTQSSSDRSNKIATTAFVSSLLTSGTPDWNMWASDNGTDGHGEGVVITLDKSSSPLTIMAGRWHTKDGQQGGRIHYDFDTECYSFIGAPINDDPSDTNWQHMRLIVRNFNKNYATYAVDYSHTDCLFIAIGK